MTATAPSYRFARSPRWVLSHILVLALIVAMILAGLWQLDRHTDRGDRNDVIEARAGLEPIALADIAPPGSAFAIGEQEQFRRVEVTGHYRSGDEVLIRNRTFNGAPGWWVLTPLVTDEGWAVAVNRGWIPLRYDADDARPGTEPPAGAVTVVGWVQPTREAEGFQQSDPAEGTLTSLGRPDIARLAAQVDYPLSPIVLQLDPDTVGVDIQPTPIPLPGLDAGPHLSYAVQWFIFTTIALVGYPLVLRRLARGRSDSQIEVVDVDKEADLVGPRR